MHRALQDSDCGNEYQNTTWEFLDRVVKDLHSSDERWGYNCKRGDCSQLSKDAIAYYCGSGTPNSNSVSVGIIDIITGTSNNCSHQWVDVTQQTRDNNAVGRWAYPRPGSFITGTNNNNNNNFNHVVSSAPNMKHIVDRLAQQCPKIMQAVWSESKQSWSGDLRFLDLTVEALRAEDNRWGYTFWTRTGHSDSWSTDRVGYFHGTGNPYNSTNMTVIDYLAPKQEDGKWVYYPSWYNATQELKEQYPDATGYWRYPRPGATVSLSDCTGESPSSVGGASNISSCSEVPNRFDIVQQVAVKTGDLYRTKPFDFTGNVASCLSEIDSNWGRRINITGPVSNDVVAYRLQGSDDAPCGVDIVTGASGDNPSLSWQEPISHTGSRWETADGSCVLNNMSSKCTQEQLDNGFGTHSQKNLCLPRCFTFTQSNINGVEMAEGSACDDRVNYNILEIKNTFEDRCCRRSPKNSCPMGYRLTRGNCQPTCSQAAGLAGYTQKAGHNRAGNYVLHEKQTFANDANCRELDEYGPNGYGDWRDFNFYDPYTFRNLKNDRNTIL